MQHRSLPTEIVSKGFRHKQLWRNGDIAVYWKVALPNNSSHKEVDCGFETIIITRHNGYTLGDSYIEPAETYPGPSVWGQRGWTHLTLLEAERKFKQLLAKRNQTPTESVPEEEQINETDLEEESEPKQDPEEKEEDPDSVPSEEAPVSTPTNGHRGRIKGPPVVLSVVPDNEFSIQDLMSKNSVAYPVAVKFIQQEESVGTIKRTRLQEREGKGRKRQLFVKVS